MFGRPATTLRPGTPADVGMLPEPIEAISGDVAAGLRAQGSGRRPLFPGAVVLVARRGRVVKREAFGHAVRYSDAAPTQLPAERRVATRTDTVYDLASLSKLFTAIVAMQLVDQERLDLSAPVVAYLPAFASHGKSGITVAQLLTHTSGLVPEPTPPVWQLPDDERGSAVLGTTPAAPPGARYHYADVNFMVVALVARALTGAGLDVLVHDWITRPLGMTTTTFNPPARLLPRIAAQEYQTNPPRGMVRGAVHDENAWAFGGVAGHAGLFSDADDLAVLAQTILNGGRYGKVHILSEQAVALMLTNHTAYLDGEQQGLGFELNRAWYMGTLATPYTAGHTGFTGTALVLDPSSATFSILLTNAVHPSRSWGSINPVRRAVADGVARAVSGAGH